MTIDEAIALVKIERECVIRADACDRKCEKCDLLQDSTELTDMYEQLADWLEELKAIKSDGFTDDLLNMGFTKGYNKALNDVESEFLMCYKVHYNLQDILCVINKLKEGASDGNG